MMTSKTNESNIGDEYVKHLLEDGARTPVCGDGDMELPSWYDKELFEKGRYYYRENKFAMFVGMLCGLISVLSIPTILKVLICTGKSSSSFTAYRRYVKTIFHVVTWYGHELKPNSKSWESLKVVRNLHSASSKLSEKSNCGFITQKDMALTQFGFMGFATLKPEYLGIVGGEEFLKSIIHFWRVIGYMVGVKDEYNLCAETVEETRYRLDSVLTKIYRPCLTNVSQEFMDMTQALIDGLWSFNPIVTAKSYLFFTRRLAGVVGHKYLDTDDIQSHPNGQNDFNYKHLTGYDRYVVLSKVVIHQHLLKYKILRAYFNFQITLSEFLIYYFPFLAFHRFGLKNSYVRIFKKGKAHID